MCVNSVAGKLKVLIAPVCRLCIYLGTVALISSMLLLVADIILRNTLGVTIPGVIELIKVLLIVIFFSGMAYTQLQKEHVRVDVIVNKFSRNARMVFTCCGNLVALGIIGIISWQSVELGLYEWSIGSNTGLLGIPLWPWSILTAVFMALFALAVLVDFFDSLDELVREGGNSYLWLIPGALVVLLLFGMSFFPELLLPVRISPDLFGAIALVLMFVLIFLHVYIGAAMAVVVLWGMGYLSSPYAGLSLLGMTSQSTAGNYVFSVLPLFMWMGLLVAVGKYSRDIFMVAHKWLGHLRGGLASASVGACGIFAAVVGDPMSGAVTMSTVALPEMEKYKYDLKLSSGAIAAGSTIGVLIPPSVSFIIYGIMVEQSIGKLFMGGIIPGIIVTAAFILVITIRCTLNPQLGPQGSPTSFVEKVKSTKSGAPILALFLLVIGGIYTGLFSATEAGAVGVFCAVLMGLGMRRFSLKEIYFSSVEAVKMSGMLFFIFIYATALTQFFATTKLPFTLSEILVQLEVSRYVTISLILGMYLLLGCLMNGLPAMILTLPFVYPIVMDLGFDPIWFGIIVTMMVEIGAITPPIGITVFAIAGVTNIPMYTVFRGVTPFWLAMVIIVALLIIFPEIVLFLPNVMMGSG